MNVIDTGNHDVDALKCPATELADSLSGQADPGMEPVLSAHGERVREGEF